MATDPFSAEAQLSLTGAKRSRLGAAQVIAGLCAVGLLTLGIGYYLPLSEAQGKLGAEYKTLSETHQATVEQLEKTTEQLVTTQKERDGLSKRVAEAEKARAAVAEQVVDLNSQVSEKLSGLEKSKLLMVSREGDQTIVTIDDAKLFRGHEVEVHKPGKKSLCAFVKALKGVSVVGGYEVEAHSASSKVTNPLLRKNFSTVWEVTAARAANAVLSLAQCGLNPKTLSAVAFGDSQPNKDAPKGSTGELRIVLSPSK